MSEPFTWGSYLGVGVSLFLATAAFHFLIGVATPIAIRTIATDSTLAVSNRSDAKAYGKSPEEMIANEPALRSFRDVVWTILAGLLVGAALLEAAVTWFALRDGQAWALPTLAVEGVLLIAFWVIALWPYVKAGAPLTLADLPPFMWVPAVLLVPATVCAWLGLR